MTRIFKDAVASFFIISIRRQNQKERGCRINEMRGGSGVAYSCDCRNTVVKKLQIIYLFLNLSEGPRF